MKFQYNCIACHINQAVKIAKLVGVSHKMEEDLIRSVLEVMSTADYSWTNPEIMTLTWNKITELIGNDNPYKKLKKQINDDVLKVYDELFEKVISSDNAFLTGLKLAIEGNIIDYGANPDFEKENLTKRLFRSLDESHMLIDDSECLYNKLHDAKSLFYIGDNCGEIVLDKIFISILKNIFPELIITFAVRGGNILNDITMEDALGVGMDEIVDVVATTGNESGFVLHKSGRECQEIFENADVVIAKGQGNYEGLCNVDKENLFFLFIAKCDLVANYNKVDKSSRICKRGNSNFC